MVSKLVSRSSCLDTIAQMLRCVLGQDALLPRTVQLFFQVYEWAANFTLVFLPTAYLSRFVYWIKENRKNGIKQFWNYSRDYLLGKLYSFQSNCTTLGQNYYNFTLWETELKVS